MKHGQSLRTDFTEKRGEVIKSRRLKCFHWSDIECLQIMNVLDYVTETEVTGKGAMGANRGERRKS